MSKANVIGADRTTKWRAKARPGYSSAFDSRLHMVAQLAIDIVALTVSWYVAIQIRLLLNPYMKIHLSRRQLTELSPSMSAVLILWVVVSFWLYEVRATEEPRSWLGKLVESAVAIGTIITVCTFFSSEFSGPLSRSVVLLLTAVSLVLLAVARLPERMIMSVAADKLLRANRVAILGSPADADFLLERMGRDRTPYYRVAGLILPRGDEHLSSGQSLRVLGTSDNVGEIINREQLDRIILVSSAVGAKEAEECCQVSRRMGVTMSHPISSMTESGTRVRLRMRFGIQLLEQQPLEFTARQEIAKRAFDLVAAAALFLLLSPLLLVCAVLVRCTSEGPAFYRSRRVGKGGRHFMFLKFRSMRPTPAGRGDIRSSNERSGHIFKIKNDPRVTPLGRFMRRYSIDEAPQLLNVLKGDMSLVGPRPLPAEDLDPDGMSKEFSLWAEQRAGALPGITGLWQIRGRSDLSFQEMVDLDSYYIRHWSLWLDLKILLATPVAVFSGRGAY